jgi:hypothetical protein
MSNHPRETPLSSTRPPVEHIYTKIQVHYAGDIQDIVLKTSKEPTCGDLANTIQNAYRVPIEKQMIYFRGQPLHHSRPSNYERTLSRYGLFSGNLIRLVGRRGLLQH